MTLKYKYPESNFPLGSPIEISKVQEINIFEKAESHGWNKFSICENGTQKLTFFSVFYFIFIALQKNTVILLLILIPSVWNHVQFRFCVILYLVNKVCNTSSLIAHPGLIYLDEPVIPRQYCRSHCFHRCPVLFLSISTWCSYQ